MLTVICFERQSVISEMLAIIICRIVGNSIFQKFTILTFRNAGNYTFQNAHTYKFLKCGAPNIFAVAHSVLARFYAFNSLSRHFAAIAEATAHCASDWLTIASTNAVSAQC